MSEAPGPRSLAPKVSVITPLYNSAAFVEKTLDSLLAQTYENWESVLVDDGSTDGTASVVAPYLKDARFRYLRQENQGIAAARNAGIRAAAGEWVCLLDHDDRWLPTKLERQVRFASGHGCRLVGTDAFIVRGAERWVYSAGFPREMIDELRRAADDPAVDVLGLFIRLNPFCTCSVMVHRSLFERRGLFDPAAAPADDYEMWLRCLPEAKTGFLDEPLVEYYIHGENYSRHEIRMLEKIIFALRKNRGRPGWEGGRLRQFDEALIFQYDLLFKKARDEGAYGAALRHAAALLREGPRGWRVLWWAAPISPLTRLRNSISYRLNSPRA